MPVEVYPLSYERHAFQFKAEPLLGGRTPNYFDLAARTEYALPREVDGDCGFQKARDGSMIPGVSGRGSHLAVAGDLSPRDGTDGFCKSFVPDFRAAH